MKPLFFLALLLLSVTLLAAQKSYEEAPVPVDQEPHHHSVFKNEFVLVMRVTLQEKEETLYHVHSHDRLSVALSSTSFAQQKPNEPESLSASIKPGLVAASTKTPWIHRVLNLGPGTYDVLDIEFLQWPQQRLTPPSGPVPEENLNVEVNRWPLAPGASSPMHTHNRPYLIIAATKMLLKMTGPAGQSSTHEVQAGDFHWVDTKVIHSLTNEGSTEGQIVEVELK